MEYPGNTSFYNSVIYLNSPNVVYNRVKSFKLNIDNFLFKSMEHLSIKQNKSISKQLLQWFKVNRRSLPWRENRSWYSIWISEVMLQQTQIATVIPYYKRFLNTFPTVTALARADLQQVLKLWEGLGYYSRAQNLHKSAQIIQSRYEGLLPESVDLVQKLPGFGPYITHAVLSIAYAKPLAVVDGNVQRIISRLFTIEEDIRRSETKRKIQDLVNQLIDRKNPGDFNEALMDLGSTICLPKNPSCTLCPLDTDCIALATNTVSNYPHKSPPQSKKIMYSLALICASNGKLLIAQRPAQGLLAGLWEFPFYKMESDFSIKTIEEEDILRSLNLSGQPVVSIFPVTHTYTHFKLHLYSRVYQITTGEFQSDFYESHTWIPVEKIDDYPIHRAMTKLVHRIAPILKIISKG
jgi:A/G-specific adenine glycosylase